MKNFPLLINTIVSGILLSACATSVNIDYDKDINFSQLKSYRVIDVPLDSPSDTRLNSPFMRQRIVSAIDKEFTKKRYEKRSSNADMEVKYRIQLKQGLESDDSGVSIGFGTFSGHSSFGIGLGFPISDNETYDNAVLTIDVWSTKTSKLLWRGSLGRRLENGSTPESNDKLVQGIVGDILERFPP